MSKVRFSVRSMQEADIEWVMGVERLAYPYPWTEGIMRDCLCAGHYCYVCLHEDRIIGHAVMSIAADESHILNIAIDPPYQKRGFGRDLLYHLIDLARRQSVAMVFLEVRQSNRAAASLYDSTGFNEISRRKGYYPADKGREDAIVYGLTL